MSDEIAAKERFLVKSLVVPVERFPHITDDHNLRDAVRSLQEYTCGEYERMRYSEMLVIDAQRHLVGRVTLQSILKGLDPNMAQIFTGFEGKTGELPNLAILWGDSFFSACHTRFGKNIKEFMAPLPVSVKENESALEALSIMLAHNETVLPVLNEAGDTVIGVIRLEEIFSAIVGSCDGKG